MTREQFERAVELRHELERTLAKMFDDHERATGLPISIVQVMPKIIVENGKWRRIGHTVMIGNGAY